MDTETGIGKEAMERTGTGGRNRGAGGFTLIEVVIALVIIGILAFMAVPSFQGMIQKYRARSAARDFVGLFQRVRTAAVQAPAVLGNVPYTFSIDCHNDAFSVSPVLPDGSKSSFSAASDFPTVDIYAVDANLEPSPSGSQDNVTVRRIERSGSVERVSGGRNFTVFIEAPPGNRYRVQVHGTVGAVKIVSGW